MRRWYFLPCLLALGCGAGTMRPADVRPDQIVMTQTGEASWYGERHHGRRTASGEPFDMHALTAAHRTLPFGTPDEVRAEARRVRDLMSAGGGYVFAPGQEIQGDVPGENILALIEVAKEPRRDTAG